MSGMIGLLVALVSVIGMTEDATICGYGSESQREGFQEAQSGNVLAETSHLRARPSGVELSSVLH
jgi:hypothetical protein